MQNYSLHENIKNVIKEIGAVIKKLSGYNRTDKKYESSIYKAEYKKILVTAQSDKYPAIYERIVITEYLNKLTRFRDDLIRLIQLYDLLNQKELSLRSDYNVAQKQELIYDSMKGILSLMKLYLRYDKFDLFDTALKEFDIMAVTLVEQEKIVLQNYQDRYDEILNHLSDAQGILLERSYQSLVNKMLDLKHDSIDQQNISKAYSRLEKVYLELQVKIITRREKDFRKEIEKKVSRRVESINALRAVLN